MERNGLDRLDFLGLFYFFRIPALGKFHVGRLFRGDSLRQFVIQTDGVCLRIVVRGVLVFEQLLGKLQLFLGRFNGLLVNGKIRQVGQYHSIGISCRFFLGKIQLAQVGQNYGAVHIRFRLDRFFGSFFFRCRAEFPDNIL